MSVDSRSDTSQIVNGVLFARVQALERKDYGLLALIAEQAAGSIDFLLFSAATAVCTILLGSNSGLRKHGRAGSTEELTFRGRKYGRYDPSTLHHVISSLG